MLSFAQMGEFEMAASSCFTFLHYNPSDQLALSSVPFYRHKLNLTTDEFIYRDMSIELHQKSYIKGQAYVLFYLVQCQGLDRIRVEAAIGIWL